MTIMGKLLHILQDSKNVTCAISCRYYTTLITFPVRQAVLNMQRAVPQNIRQCKRERLSAASQSSIACSRLDLDIHVWISIWIISDVEKDTDWRRCHSLILCRNISPAALDFWTSSYNNQTQLTTVSVSTLLGRAAAGKQKSACCLLMSFGSWVFSYLTHQPLQCSVCFPASLWISDSTIVAMLSAA